MNKQLEKFREMVPLSDHAYDLGEAPNSYTVFLITQLGKYVRTKLTIQTARQALFNSIEKDGYAIKIVKTGLTKSEAYSLKDQIQTWQNDRCHLGHTDRERGEQFSKNNLYG